VKTPEDVKGLSIRAMDKIQAAYINAWGASTVIVTWAEIYNSLQTGVADGYLNPAIVPVMFKHTEVLKYFSDIKVSAPLRVSICSEQWYQELSEKDQAIIAEAVKKADAANRAWVSKIEINDAEALKAAGVDVYKNTPEEISQFAELSRKEYSKILSADIVALFLAASKSQR
jgi:TRAP-type transport system periplasmic protein